MTDFSVLLDLDGTLTDSRPGILGSLDLALRELGHVPDPAYDLTWIIGPPLEDVIAQILTHYGDHRTTEAVTLYRRIYGDSGIFQSTLYPGITAAMEGMVAAGCTLYLATAKRRFFAQRILDHYDLSRLFNGIYGSEAGGLFDHKPELLAHIIARENVIPKEAVMVGDRRHDIVGAHANAMRGIGVTWGYGGRAELEQAGADAVVETADALLACVKMQMGAAR
jgi:phosphoglycolate phosphatase